MGFVTSVSRRVMPFGIPLRSEFPPRRLVERPSGATIAELEARTKRLGKLENLYHKGQEAAWDGKTILREAFELHGPIDLPEEKRGAIISIFGVILWGELAAWEVASYLAENIRDNTEAKMAATIQTFDEARHFYVLRDYLKELGQGEIPPVNSFVKSILTQILATNSTVEKLVGMQLFVEHIAVHLFKHIAETNVEPVLSHLLPYFQRDESRHVALGKLHLPDLFARMSRTEIMRLQLYQMWLGSFMAMSIEYHQKDAEILGLDTRKAMTRALRDQTAMIDEMAGASGRNGGLVLPRRLRFVNRYLLRNWFPAAGESANIAFRTAHPLVQRFTHVAERAWSWVA
jgi:rubrerythrin